MKEKRPLINNAETKGLSCISTYGNHSNQKVVPLKDWSTLFAHTDTTIEAEFKDWDATITDGIIEE